jgi:hypothetical protein
VCVEVTHYKDGGTKSRAALHDQIFVSNLMKTTETYEKLKWAYGEHALSRAQVFTFLHHF